MWYYANNVALFNLSDQNNLASQARSWSYSAHFKTINICLPQKALGYHSLEVQQLVTAQQLYTSQPRGPTAVYVSPNCGEKHNLKCHQEPAANSCFHEQASQQGISSALI